MVSAVVGKYTRKIIICPCHIYPSKLPTRIVVHITKPIRWFYCSRYKLRETETTKRPTFSCACYYVRLAGVITTPLAISSPQSTVTCYPNTHHHFHAHYYYAFHRDVWKHCGEEEKVVERKQRRLFIVHSHMTQHILHTRRCILHEKQFVVGVDEK